MADTTYRVLVDLSVHGNLGTQVGQLGNKVNEAHGSMEKLGGSVAEFGRSVAESFGAAAERVGDLGLHMMKLGALAGVGIATYAVGHLNNELEQTQISLAAIFRAQGFSSNFQSALQLSTETVAKMKQDVKTLPGDLGQLANIMKTIATPAAQAGANVDMMRQLAGKSMLVGTILSVPPEVMAREMAQLLAGRAGAHNIFGTRLGLVGEKAKEFNQLAPEVRLARINQEMAKYNEAADTFGKSFIANFTTLKDNLKYSVMAEATQPLFEHVKASIIDVNTWFDNNKQRVEEFARSVGQKLGSAWDYIVSRAEKLGPVVDKLERAFVNMKPGELGKDIEKAGLTFAALKFGPGMLGSLFGMAGSVGKLGGGLMEGLGGAGAGAVEGAAAGGPVTLAATAAALSALVDVAVVAGGALHALMDETSSFHQEAVGLWEHIKASSSDALNSIESAWHRLEPIALHLADAMGTTLLQSLAFVADRAAEVAQIVDMLAASFKAAVPWITAVINTLGAPFGVEVGKGGAHWTDVTKQKAPNVAAFDPFGGWGSEKTAKVLASAMKTGGGGGGGGTHVQKVEIVVNSNQDPSRIARLTLAEIENLKRHPKVSPGAPNYRIPEPGF